MKKLSLSLLLLVFYCIDANSQENLSKLRTFLDIAKIEAQISRIKGFGISTGKSKTITIKDLPTIVDAYNLNANNSKDDEAVTNGTLLTKYKTDIKKYCEEVYSFAGSSSEIYYDLKPDIKEIKSIPIGFALHNNSLVFFQSGVYYDKIINTLKLSADERASFIAKECVVPSLKNFGPLLHVNEIKYFALIYSFIAKDFSSDEMPNAEGETVTIIVPKEAIKRFINLEITQDELYSAALFYNSNKNTEGGLRKIIVK